MKPEVYRYGLTVKYVRIMSVILSLLLLIYGSLHLLLGVFGIMMLPESGIRALSVELEAFLINLLQAALFFLFGLHIFSDVEIDGSGLRIKYILRSRTIPWQNILDIEKVVLLGLIRNPKWKVIVCTTGLPFIFRLFGLIYTGSTMPVIPVSPSISEYQRLIERISLQIKREDRRSELRERNHPK
jgi:hypothetical protein